MVSHASLLRASGQESGQTVDVRVATGEAPDPDGGVPHGAALRRFATAILEASADLPSARDALVEATGPGATVQAASIVASFDGINRVADATGIRLDAESEARGASKIVEVLGLEALGAPRR